MGEIDGIMLGGWTGEYEGAKVGNNEGADDGGWTGE